MAKPPSPQPPASFETALSELESIVESMERGGAPLEASLAAYERGVALLKYCQEALVGAERKLRILEDGQLRDFSETEAGGPADD